MTASGIADAALAPLDRLRSALLRAAMAAPPLRALVARREVRIVAQACLGVAASLVITSAIPMLMFALSPLLLGVPHVAGDVRYLLLRPRLPRAWLYTGAAIIAVMVALRSVEAWLAPRIPAAVIEGGLGFSWMVAAALFGARLRGSARALRWMLPSLLMVGAAIAWRPHGVLKTFPFLHNLVALALWAIWFREVRRLAWLPLAAVAAGVALLLSGATLPLAQASFAGSSLADAAALLVPGVPVDWGVRLVLVYVFTQSVHYAVWIGWIPQENLRTEGTLTFRQTARGITRDFGRPGALALVASLTALWIWVAATRDVYGTRSLYLSLANFHGLLELATICFVLAAGLSLRRAGA